MGLCVCLPLASFAEAREGAELVTAAAKAEFSLLRELAVNELLLAWDDELAFVKELELAPDEHPKEAGGESDSRQT